MDSFSRSWAFGHFVFALGVGVGVVDHVADVGHVHDLADAGAAEFEIAAEDIGEEEGTEVADVGEVVDGRAAGVHLDGGAGERVGGIGAGMRAG